MVYQKEILNVAMRRRERKDKIIRIIEEILDKSLGKYWTYGGWTGR